MACPTESAYCSACRRYNITGAHDVTVVTTAAAEGEALPEIFIMISGTPVLPSGCARILKTLYPQKEPVAVIDIISLPYF
jgi:hypothetical protein